MPETTTPKPSDAFVFVDERQTVVTVDDVMAKLATGATLKDVAAGYGRSYGYVASFLRRNGVESRRQSIVWERPTIAEPGEPEADE